MPSGRDIYWEEAETIVLDQTFGMWEHGYNTLGHVFRLWDDWYYSPSKQQVYSLLNKVCPTVPSYEPEKFDCDDQAFFFRSQSALWALNHTWSDYGLCLGIVRGEFGWMGGDHVACWLLYEDGSETKMAWIDPQLQGKSALQPLELDDRIVFLLA